MPEESQKDLFRDLEFKMDNATDVLFYKLDDINIFWYLQVYVATTINIDNSVHLFKCIIWGNKLYGYYFPVYLKKFVVFY